MVSYQALPMDTICPQSCWSAIPGSGVAPPRVMAVAAPWVMCVAPPRFMAVAMEGCGGQGGGLLYSLQNKGCSGTLCVGLRLGLSWITAIHGQGQAGGTGQPGMAVVQFPALLGGSIVITPFPQTQAGTV